MRASLADSWLADSHIKDSFIIAQMQLQAVRFEHENRHRAGQFRGLDTPCGQLLSESQTSNLKKLRGRARARDDAACATCCSAAASATSASPALLRRLRSTVFERWGERNPNNSWCGQWGRIPAAAASARAAAADCNCSWCHRGTGAQ